MTAPNWRLELPELVARRARKRAARLDVADIDRELVLRVLAAVQRADAHELRDLAELLSPVFDRLGRARDVQKSERRSVIEAVSS
jgi:molecular chaperone GrpE (heat shock protein)